MSVKNTEILGSINQKIVADGENLPAVKLKDGSRVQTGTVATMLYNITQYNLGNESVVAELEAAIPTLFKVGLFDLFVPEEWASDVNLGRSLVGSLALDYIRQKNLNEVNEVNKSKPYKSVL